MTDLMFLISEIFVLLLAGVALGVALGFLAWRFRRRSLTHREWNAKEHELREAHREVYRVGEARDSEQGRVATLTTSLEERDQELTALRVEREEVSTRADGLEHRLSGEAQVAETLRHERDAAVEGLASARSELAETRSDNDKLGERASALDHRILALEERSARLDQVEIHVAEQNEEIGRLRGDLASAESVAMRVTPLQTEVDLKSGRVNELEAELRLRRIQIQELEALRSKVASLSNQITARDRTIERLQAQVRAADDDLGLLPAVAEPRPVSVEELRAAADRLEGRARRGGNGRLGSVGAPSPAVPTRPADPSGESGGAVVVDLTRGPQPGHEEPEPRLEADDLQRIQGIGPVLETMLHDLGIWRYDQIAELNDEGTDRLQTQLADFPDRIRRDEWIRQARALLADRPRDKSGDSRS